MGLWDEGKEIGNQEESGSERRRRNVRVMLKAHSLTPQGQSYLAQAPNHVALILTHGPDMRYNNRSFLWPGGT